MIVISKELTQPMCISLYSPNPGAIRYTVSPSNPSNKIIVVVCYSGIGITNPVPGVSYTASYFADTSLGGANMIAGDGGRNTSTWCVFNGACPFVGFFSSGHTSRTTYNVLIQEYTDDTLLDYSQEIGVLIPTGGFTNYGTITTRR